MKAVRAYTCDDKFGNATTVVVCDEDKHYAFCGKHTVGLYKGKDMSALNPWPSQNIELCTNIQPVELPDKEEV